MSDAAPPGGGEELATEWFQSVDESFHQGDVLLDFPLPVITYDEGSGVLDIQRSVRSVIVVTQTCDIPKPAQGDLLVAQVFDYGTVRAMSPVFASSKYREALSRGMNLSEFALPPRPRGNGEFQIVSFRHLQVVPKAYAKAHRSESLRLRSPYKEYFAQAYARFMMRVGLPMPLPKIT